MPRQAGWEVGRVPGFYQGAGVPSASTLVAGDYQIGDYYVNTSANTLYICSTAGSASTSVWTQVGASTTAPAITFKKGSQAGDYSTASATYVDVDASNLGATITVAVGQKLTVRAQGTWQISAVANASLRIVDGTTAVHELLLIPAGGTQPQGYAMEAVIAGDGAAHTAKLQFAVTGGATLNLKNNAASTTTTPNSGFQTMTFRLETAT